MGRTLSAGDFDLDRIFGQEGVAILHLSGLIGALSAETTACCVAVAKKDGSVISGPDIITRGFIYVKESEELMNELREVAMEAIDRCQRKRVKDWATLKSAIKNDLSGYLFKTTKRNPMILPVITEI